MKRLLVVAAALDVSHTETEISKFSRSWSVRMRVYLVKEMSYKLYNKNAGQKKTKKHCTAVNVCTTGREVTWFVHLVRAALRFVAASACPRERGNAARRVCADRCESPVRSSMLTFLWDSCQQTDERTTTARRQASNAPCDRVLRKLEDRLVVTEEHAPMANILF